LKRSVLKLFDKKSLGVLARFSGVSGMSAASVQMRQIRCLSTALSQIETMLRIKPDDQCLRKSTDVLNTYLGEIKKIIQPVAQVKQEELPAEESSAVNRGPQ
jgi:hypothetical protein